MDYKETARKLRIKAADPATTEAESRALLDKAHELEAKIPQLPAVSKIPLWTEMLGQMRITTNVVVVKNYDFPDDYYDTMDDWGDTSDWYSGDEK